MLRRLYDWTLSLAAGPRAPQALGAVAFAESSVFPLPPDLLLIPMCVGNRQRAWYFAAVCTVASVLGGLLGYLIGAILFEQVATPILTFYGYMDKFDQFKQIFDDWGWWFVFIAGLTPFPYKVITIASGVFALNLPVFILASIISRGIRFFCCRRVVVYVWTSHSGLHRKAAGVDVHFVYGAADWWLCYN